jgi:hypothetical protein
MMMMMMIIIIIIIIIYLTLHRSTVLYYNLQFCIPGAGMQTFRLEPSHDKLIF